MERDVLPLGTWAVVVEYDRPLEPLALEERWLPEPDDLLEPLACDDPLECECDDPLEEDEWEEPDDLLEDDLPEDDDLDLSPPRDANETSGTRTHRVRPASLTIEFLGCNSI